MAHEPGCPFCFPHMDPHQQIVLENEHCYFLQKEEEQSVLEGSGLIVPKHHRVDVFELTAEEWAATQDLLQKAKSLLDAYHSPDGFTLGWNVGRASNQHILHAYLHVIPRFMDETHAGKGLRYWLKQPENTRKTKSRPTG